MRVLSIDVGTNKFGLSITDNEQTLIFPLQKIFLKKPDLKIFFNLLKEVLSDKFLEIELVVIGCSYDEDFLDSNRKVLSVQNQVKRYLSSWTNWKIETISESFTSIQAFEMMRKLNFSKGRIKKNIDSYAALIILHDYFLNRNRHLKLSF